jgi:hypothetical protein
MSCRTCLRVDCDLGTLPVNVRTSRAPPLSMIRQCRNATSKGSSFLFREIYFEYRSRCGEPHLAPALRPVALVSLSSAFAWLAGPQFHVLDVADFKGVRAGQYFGERQGIIKDKQHRWILDSRGRQL